MRILKKLRKTAGCSILGWVILSLFLALAFCQVSWAQGDNLWNIRNNSDDRFHDNTPWLRPWRYNYDDGVGQWIGYWSYEVPWGPVSTIGGSDGSFSIGRDRDHQFHVWTYVRVETARTISLYGAGNCVPRVFLNYDFDSPIVFSANHASLALQSGWNRIDITGYNQNEGYGFTCGALAALVDAMNSSEILNQPPIADAGSDQTVTDSDGNGIEQVTLDGSGSSDSDGTIVSWIWTDNLGDTIPDGEIITATLSVGIHTITLTVTDNDGLTDTDTVMIAAQIDWGAVENQIEGIRSNYNLPSIGYALVVMNTPVFTGAVGQANISENIDATADTPYMLASISKTFVATALLQLIEAGQLSLDDPVNDHLPWTLDNPRVSGEVIRASHLVTHTSGIRDASGNWDDPGCENPGSGTCFFWEGDAEMSLAEAMEGYFLPGGEWYDATKNFTTNMPGDNYQYCNYTASLAGFLVECITGIELRDHSIDNLFVPLGMTNSGWRISDFPDPLLVAMPYDDNNNEYGQYNWAEYPDGQLRSSPNDLAEYMAAMLGGGKSRTGVRVLESASVDTAFADVFGNIPDQGVFWYRGNYYGELDACHSGGYYGVATNMCLLLNSRVGVVVLVNQDGNGARTARRQVMDLLVDRGRELASQISCDYTCGDLDGDGGNVDADDVDLFNACWQKDIWFYPDCICANLVEFGNHTIDSLDLAVLNELLSSSSSDYPPNDCSTSVTDPYPPSPAPNFATAPYATGKTSIKMVATRATDVSGVEYYFACTAGGGHDSGWQDSRTYEDTSLLPVTTYTYTVKARDMSDNYNETDASAGASATTFLYENLVLPANGGVLESFTSEYGEYGGEYYLAADLTNGITDEAGWSSASSPKPRQEFVYSFLDGKNATLKEAVIHGGTAEGMYYSKDVEVWTSANGTSFTLVGSGTLLAQPNDSVTLDLGDIEAKKVKLRITSGYRTDYWELAEFVVFGVQPDLNEPLYMLADDVIDLDLHPGIANSLLAKINTAIAKLEDGNAKNDKAAINSLEAFINAVEAQRGNKISEEDADALIAAVQEIIAVLSGT